MEDVRLFAKDITVFNLEVKNKRDLFEKMSEMLYQAKRINNCHGFVKALYEREKEFSTALSKGFAIPHARCEYVNYPSVGIAKLNNSIDDYQSLDGSKIDFIFMIAVPKNSESNYMMILSGLARKLMHETFTEKLRNCVSSVEVISLLEEEIGN